MSEPKSLLIVEDEPAIVRFLRASLRDHGWRTIETSTGRQAIELTASHKPDAILLDLGLPDQDGMETLRSIRQWTSVPVIIISARDQENDKVMGLDAGADDYLTKPFGIEELLARLRVAMRHRDQSLKNDEAIYTNGDFKIDIAKRLVWQSKKEVHLSPIQFDVLALLVKNAGRIVSHKLLIKEVWGEDRVVTPELIRITIHQLRHKIETDPVRPQLLKTEPGIGYRFASLEKDDSLTSA